jgi:hypothetical protein
MPRDYWEPRYIREERDTQPGCECCTGEAEETEVILERAAIMRLAREMGEW